MDYSQKQVDILETAYRENIRSLTGDDGNFLKETIERINRDQDISFFNQKARLERNNYVLGKKLKTTISHEY